MLIEDDLRDWFESLILLFQVDSEFVIVEDNLEPVLMQEVINLEAVQGNLYYNEAKRMTEVMVSLEKNRFLPELQLEYYLSTNKGPAPNFYNAYTVGIALPLWFGAQKANLRSSKLQKDIVSYEADSYRLVLQSKHEQLQSKLQLFKRSVDYYNNTGKELALEIVKTAEKSYYGGEINFFQYIQSLDEATAIVLDYLENLNNYNQTILEIKYLNY